MINLQNPFEQKKHEKIREYEVKPTGELKREIDELETKSAEFVEQQMKNVSARMDDIREKAIQTSTATEKDKKVSVWKQYKKMCQLYKDADNLVKEIRGYKKELRQTLGLAKE